MNRVISKEVLEQLRHGNHTAFETVFLSYFGKIKDFIYALIKSDAEAEELAQDIFMKLWENRQSIDSNRNIGSYLYVIARNTSFNFLKSRNVHAAYVRDFTFTNEESHSEDPLFVKELKLLEEMIVDQMPEQRRRIYKLSRENGLKNEEIANQLQISKKTIENQISLACKELKKVMSLFFLIFP